MPFQFTSQTILITPDGTVSKSVALTGGLKVSLNEVAPIAAATEYFLGLDVQAVKAFSVASTQDVTIKTNSNTSPDNTMVLVANSPYIWTTDSVGAFALTVDVTKIFINNASAAEAIVTINALVDSTP